MFYLYYSDALSLYTGHEDQWPIHNNQITTEAMDVSIILTDGISTNGSMW